MMAYKSLFGLQVFSLNFQNGDAANTNAEHASKHPCQIPMMQNDEYECRRAVEAFGYTARTVFSNNGL